MSSDYEKKPNYPKPNYLVSQGGFDTYSNNNVRTLSLMSAIEKNTTVIKNKNNKIGPFCRSFEPTYVRTKKGLPIGWNNVF